LTDVFTIKDVENLSGIKAHTIRIWEQRYNFLKPGRTETNIRYYSGEELKTVLQISLLNKHGYKISHINKMSGGELRAKAGLLGDNGAQLHLIVNELIIKMVDLDMEAFERTLDRFIRIQGIDKALHRVVFPFLHRIGILWAGGYVHPAQEQLVTHIIRQKLIVGIEGMMTQRQTDRTLLLFLPEGEQHDLGLLYVHYLLRAQGAKVLYLGANVPLKDVEFVCRKRNPDYLFMHLKSAGSYNLERFLQLADQLLPPIPLIISGQPVRAQVRRLSPTVNIRRSGAEILEFIHSL
jgi:MerR family transcriptional regulator, light-induced transcriptional regulator